MFKQSKNAMGKPCNFFAHWEGDNIVASYSVNPKGTLNAGMWTSSIVTTCGGLFPLGLTPSKEDAYRLCVWGMENNRTLSEWLKWDSVSV